MNECVNFGACRVVSLRDTPRNAQQAGYNCHQYAKKKYSYKNKNKHLYIMIIRYDVLERASCSNTTNLSASFKKKYILKQHNNNFNT